MKKLKALLFLGLAGITTIAGAADIGLYTAYNSPNAAEDSTDGTNLYDLWTVDGAGGADRSLLKASQDGDTDLWAIWDLDGEGETYATCEFPGGPLEVGQTVSLDWCHRVNIDDAIGIRYLNNSNIEAEFTFIGGYLYFSYYDTGSGVYTETKKRYDNYDIFRVSFTLTGANSYMMSATEGSMTDIGRNDIEDGNADVGDIVDQWTGTFTGASIDAIEVYTAGGNESDIWFDNLNINKGWLKTPSNEEPMTAAIDVPVTDLELSWTIARQYNNGSFSTDPNLVSYNVYVVEDDPNFLNVTPYTVDSWDNTTLKAAVTPAELNKNKTCYWRVDTVNNDNTIVEGPVWYFGTELTKAFITSNPQRQVVDGGTVATFTVTADSDTPATYQWYKYVDGENDIALTDGGDISGSTTDTLTIANSDVDDEGFYYCAINNDSNIIVNSTSAQMGIKRMMAYWTFEDNSIDSVIAGSPATIAAGTPTFVAEGIEGSAIEFTENEDLLYADPFATEYFDVCDYGLTVACWVKSVNTKTWVPLIARNGENSGWQLRKHGYTANRPCFTTRGTGNEDGTSGDRNIYDGEWHYVVGTFDGSMKKLYIDGTLSTKYSADTGELVHTGDSVATPIRKSLSPIAIGGRVSGEGEEIVIETNNNCAGVYDNVAIYNYALDAEAIAQIYADTTGQSVCDAEQAYDLDGDCKVDISDLGKMASEWLSSTVIEPSVE